LKGSTLALIDAIERAVQSTAPLPSEPSLAQGSPIDRLRAYASHDRGAATALEELISDDADPEGVTTLDRVRRLIARTERRALGATDTRYGTLGSLLDRLYARERALTPDPPPAPDAVLEVWRGRDAEAIALIEHLLETPIAAAEIR
jgi:hypothetical protein